MRFLLDTQILIWLDKSPEKLSLRALEILRDKDMVLLLSYVSIWEMQIKRDIGKLSLSGSIAEVIEKQQRQYRLYTFPIEIDAIYALATLPDHHRDPFDRLLVAQAVSENLPIVTSDPLIARYPILTVW